MATEIIERNIIGFRSGMHKSCTGYAETAFAMRLQPTPPQAAPRDHRLAARQLLALPNEYLSLICLSGELWLTRDGDIEDYILGPGQSLAIRPGDQAAVQALRPSELRLLALSASAVPDTRES